MKTLLYISVLFSFGCRQQAKHADESTQPDTTKNVMAAINTAISKYYTTKDTLIITTETADTLKYSKDEFNAIVDKYPELLNIKYVQNPDLIYYCSGDRDQFTSEAGQDEYYILYACFLKQKNGVERYAEQRKNLIDIYSNINLLFARFQYGGTYFGHQRSRILGYAEFAVHLFIEHEKNISKTYDITKEKAIYINSLRQMIKDEISIDSYTSVKERPERNNELNRIVDNIDKLITGNFYLKQAQAFQYDKYQYY